jgi:hypothetical protein
MIVNVEAGLLTIRMRIAWYAKVVVATQMVNQFEAMTNLFG